MASAKTRKGKEKNGYRVELSIKSVIFYIFCLCVLLGWTFVLGIFVGRGVLPEGVNGISALKSQLARLEDRVSPERRTDLQDIEKLDKDPQLAFYEKLSAKKEEKVRQTSGSSHSKKTGESEQRPLSPSENRGPYTIQLASLSSQSRAQRLVGNLVKKGYPAYVHEAKVKGKTYYRVRCGRYGTRTEAMTLSKTLIREEGLKGFVFRMQE